jgi:putative redox protein
MSSIVFVGSVDGECFPRVIESGEHQLFADEPKSVGGSDRGPGPYDYLLAALGS